jgi:hypothetical protein
MHFGLVRSYDCDGRICTRDVPLQNPDVFEDIGHLATTLKGNIRHDEIA